MADANIDGVLIQSMVTGGIETMIGIADDPLFGPLVAFGLGGINVEVLGDVRFRMTPLTDRDADELLYLNPVIAIAPGHGCRMVDARVKVRTLA